MTAGTRAQVVCQIADHLVALPLDHPLRVAVDGITASGKTTLAGELATAIQQRGRDVIQLTGDGFHHRSAHRYRRGRDSADGYYEDAYDFDKLARLTLAPLGPGGDRRYHVRVHDLRSDGVIEDEVQLASDDAIVLLDGSFLQRSDVAGHWDVVVFVDTSFEVARARGAARDAVMFGGRGRALHAFDARYHPACRRYVDEVAPADRASIVVTNDDIMRPQLLRMVQPAQEESANSAA